MTVLPRKCLTALIVLVFIAGCAGPKNGGQPMSAPPDGPAVKYTQPVPEQWQLSNGLRVVFLYDDEIPLVRGSLYLSGGSLWEPREAPGVVEVMGQQMRLGGAGAYDADELDLELEKLSAGISSEYSSEFGNITFSCLSADFERLFGIFRDVVRDPRFQQDRLDLWKGQAIEAIRRRVDDPGTVASLAFKEILFGGTPLGQTLTEDDVRRIQRVGLLRMHRTMVHPDRSYLLVVGKINRANLEQLVEKAFGDWQGTREVPEPPKIDNTPAPGIYFIELPFTQSTVYMGHAGPPRLSPDHIAIEGFNNIFGSGDFGSRLMKRIRTELGLVYAVFGGVFPGFPVGQTTMVLQTKSETTGAAIAESLKTLEDMRETPVEPEELSRVKESIKNSFIFRLDTPDDLARRVVLLRLLNYPADYDQTYIPKVDAMNRAEIRQVATERWDTGKMVIVVVGNESAYNALEQRVRAGEFPVNTLKRCVFDQKLRSCS